MDRRRAITSSALMFALLVAASALVATPRLVMAQAGQQLEDVVYLKNKSVARGIIVEQKPNEYILLRMRDGSVMRYDMGDIDRIAKEAPIIQAGQQQPTRSMTSMRSPGVSLGWSFLINGGGQFYNGEAAKGVLQLGVGILGLGLMVAGYEDCWEYSDYDCTTYTIGAVTAVGTKIWSMYDAYASAKRINREAGFSFLGRDVEYVGLSLSPLRTEGPRGPRPGGALVMTVR